MQDERKTITASQRPRHHTLQPVVKTAGVAKLATSMIEKKIKSLHSLL